jgi:peptidyl-prolyl cis-trans isomerase C
VATVEGANIYLPEIGDAMADLPDEAREQAFEYLYPELLKRVVDTTALRLKGDRLGLDTDPDVRRRMVEAAYAALAKEVVRRAFQRELTEDRLQARYAERYGSKKGLEEVRLGVIVVSDPAQARAILGALHGGADFATLARERSNDPSGVVGGDIGFVRVDQLKPEQADAVQGLPAGGTAADAVKGPFGWEIFKVEERRVVPVPTFQQARSGLRQELAQEIVAHEIEQARAEVQVREYNLNGTPLRAPDLDTLDDAFRFRDFNR